MKRKISGIISAIRVMALLIAYLGALQIAFAQPQPSENGDGSDTDGEPLRGAAPIGSGITVLLLMGAGYAARKIYNAGKKPENTEKSIEG
ncbi:MAG: hypothetical protein NT175_08260 [Bacteroidetes bacterium]|nr:hypothetical protein [Bacteroidota bacterium]